MPRVERAPSVSDRLILIAGLAVLAADGALSGLIAARGVAATGGVWFPVTLACVVLPIAVAGVVAFHQCGRSWRAVAISPYSIAAATWLALFVLRPLELYFSPDQAAQSLAQLGFRPGDLTRTVALGGLGCAAWCLGYLLALGRPRHLLARPARKRVLRLSLRGTWIVLAAGTALWVALFFRQGGISTLRYSAVSIRANQSASFYGFIGVWIVQGVALYTFAAVLQTRSRGAKLAVAVAALLSVAAAVALQLRGLAAFAAVAAVAIYVSLRPLSRRRLAVLVVGGAVAILALGFAQQTRQYTAQRSLSSSIRLAERTPLGSMYASDLSTYDNFVAIHSLVPSSIGYLDGRSLAEIPGALIPRTLWAGKPRGLDVLAGSYLYPGTNAAVAISMQGELYWNAGVPGVAIGAFVLGLLFGLLAAVGLRAPPGTGWFVLYAVAVVFTHAFLTRGLATMTENLVFALVGVSLAILGTGGARELGGVWRGVGGVSGSAGPRREGDTAAMNHAATELTQTPVAADTAAELYLELLKRSLTRSAFGERYQPIDPLRGSWKRLLYGAHLPVRRALGVAGLELVRRTEVDPAFRAEGRDHPPDAETMIGLRRLDNIQACLTDVLAQDVPGDLIETGVWRGGATIFMRGILKAYGDGERVVWVADSFRGLPHPGTSGRPEDEGDSFWRNPHLAVSVDEVRENFLRYDLLDKRVRFLQGWFEETLPTAPIEGLALLRLDGDMYSSTMVALESLYPKVSVGGYVLVDDYGGGARGCAQAVDEFRAREGISEPLVSVDWNGAYWQRLR